MRKFTPLPPNVQKTLEAGGLVPKLKKELHAKPMRLPPPVSGTRRGFDFLRAVGQTLRRVLRIAASMALKIVLLAGDGVGPEVMREAVKVLKAVESAYGVSFDLVPFPCGGQHYLDTGEEWPDGAFGSCKAADAILLGAVGLPEAVLPNGDVAGVGVVFGPRFRPARYPHGGPAKLYQKVRNECAAVATQGG